MNKKDNSLKKKLFTALKEKISLLNSKRIILRFVKQFAYQGLPWIKKRW